MNKEKVIKDFDELLSKYQSFGEKSISFDKLRYIFNNFIDKYILRYDFMLEKVKLYEEIIKNSNFAPMIKKITKKEIGGKYEDN